MLSATASAVYTKIFDWELSSTSCVSPQGSASGIEFGGGQGQTENAETVGSIDMVHSATAGTMASGTSQVATDGNFEDDEEEPKLRYQRLGGSLTDLLKDDTAR